MHLLDANVLIRAHEDFYAIDRVPQFWEWLLDQADADQVKMPYEIHREIAVARGPLRDWICAASNLDRILLDEEVDSGLLDTVITMGYAPDLTDSELEKIGQDPFLVAYALAVPGRSVVTKETSKPSKTRANRKVPDVCSALGVPWITDFALYRLLDFHTR